MPREELVLLGCLTSAHQVTQRLMGSIRHPDWGEISAPIAACKLEGISAVGLDAITGFDGYQRGGDDFAEDADLCQKPVEYVATGARLIAHAQRLDGPQLLDQLSDCLRLVGDRPQ